MFVLLCCTAKIANVYHRHNQPGTFSLYFHIFSHLKLSVFSHKKSTDGSLIHVPTGWEVFTIDQIDRRRIIVKFKGAWLFSYVCYSWFKFELIDHHVTRLIAPPSSRFSIDIISVFLFLRRVFILNHQLFHFACSRQWEEISVSR